MTILGKDKIAEVAASLFEEQGYTATSVQNIASACGCTKAALYYYYASKEDILWEIIDKTMSTAERRMQDLIQQKISPVESIERVIKNTIKSVIDDFNFMAVFFAERDRLSLEKKMLINKRRRIYEEHIAEFIRQGIREGIFYPVPVIPVVYGILGMCNWIYQWYNPLGPCSPEELAVVYSQAMLHGLLKRNEAPTSKIKPQQAEIIRL